MPLIWPMRTVVRSVISAPPAMVHRRPAPSVNDVAPGVCPLKLGLATTAPLRSPDRNSARVNRPAYGGKLELVTSPISSGAVLEKTDVVPVSVSVPRRWALGLARITASDAPAQKVAVQPPPPLSTSRWT